MTSRQIARNFVDIDGINKHLFCSICQEVFRKPALIKCGHSFCKHCIAMWRVNHKHCPICRTEIQAKDPLVECKCISEIVDEQEVKCAQEDCMWRGKLKEQSQHEKECSKYIKEESKNSTQKDDLGEVQENNQITNQQDHFEISDDDDDRN